MKAFSFIEVIISIAIGSAVLIAVFSLASQNLIAADLTRHRVIAAHLAQEGVEIVINKRSSNWLTFSTEVNPLDGTLCEWRGPADCISPDPDCAPGDPDCLADGTSYIAQYNSTSLTPTSNPSDQLLSIDSNFLYCHAFLGGCVGSFSPSPYNRVISISTINDHHMKIVSTISWVYNNQPHSVSVEDRLYNWR